MGGITLLQMTNEIRVRFPPSPTGELHVGNVRTAIFNWLFARSNKGNFIIRIEDTDQARKIDGAIEATLTTLRWLGLDWDEGPDIGGDFGPYIQSERLDSYLKASEQLVNNGKAYRCFCTSERLAEMRQVQKQTKQSIGYDRRCRMLNSTDSLKRADYGEKYVVRFAMPYDGVTKIADLVRGDVTYENSFIDDFVILKSDRFPTYHLAHVVDDHAMKISHVLRAEEWLPSAPRHVRIYEAFGWVPPKLAHLPMILAPNRSKLSKRHGATSTLEYQKLGYLPETMLNFLALLGWSLDDKTEIFSISELIKNFSIDRVSKSGAIFNPEKLTWLNGYYIRKMTDKRLTNELLNYWKHCPTDNVPKSPEKKYLLKIVPLIKERLKNLSDAAPLIMFFFQSKPTYNTIDLVQKGMDTNSTKKALEKSHDLLKELAPFSANTIEDTLRPLAEKLGIKVGQLLGSLRIATTGLRVAPPLFQTIEVLGQKKSLALILEASKRL